MFIRLIYVACFIVACLIGWQLWSNHTAYDRLAKHPFGQYIGPENPEFVFVEIMDYRCAACRGIYDTVQEVLERNPEVGMVYRHYPVFGKPSLHEAQLALAAGMQGKFKEMHEILIRRETPISDSDIDIYGKQLGLDVKKLRVDMKAREMGFDFLATVGAAEALNIKATPTFIFGKTVYTPTTGMPTVEKIENMINEARGIKSKEDKMAPPAKQTEEKSQEQVAE